MRSTTTPDVAQIREMPKTFDHDQESSAADPQPRFACHSGLFIHRPRLIHHGQPHNRGRRRAEHLQLPRRRRAPSSSPRLNWTAPLHDYRDVSNAFRLTRPCGPLTAKDYHRALACGGSAKLFGVQIVNPEFGHVPLRIRTATPDVQPLRERLK